MGTSGTFGRAQLASLDSDPGSRGSLDPRPRSVDLLTNDRGTAVREQARVPDLDVELPFWGRKIITFAWVGWATTFSSISDPGEQRGRVERPSAGFES